jgi:peroxiredoxin
MPRIYIGQKAPDFTLESHLGFPVTLSSCLGSKNVLIVFFPLAFTPV